MVSKNSHILEHTWAFSSYREGAHLTCKGSTSSQNSNRWFSLKNSHMSVNAFYRFNRDSSWVSLHLFTGSIQIHHVWASFHFDTAGSRRRAHESPQFVIWVGGCHAMGARCSEAARFSSDARRCYPPRGVASSPAWCWLDNLVCAQPTTSSRESSSQPLADAVRLGPVA